MSASQELMTKTQYAAYLHVGASYVSRLQKQGRLVLAPDGRIDVAATDALLKETTAVPKRSKVVEQTPEYVDHKERAEKHRADLLEMDVAERKGTLLPLDDVKSTVMLVVTTLRTGLEALPDRVAPMVTAKSDEAQIRAIMAVEVEALLDELTHALQRFVKKAGH